MFFKADVLSEEAILKWYNEAHLAKGKSVFLEQMKKFVEWLKNAEEGKRLTAFAFSTSHICRLPEKHAMIFCFISLVPNNKLI